MNSENLEQQYMAAVQAVRNEISAGDLVKAEQQLNELYCYKPVRLVWFVAEAELRWKQGRLDEVFPRLDNVLIAVWDYSGVRECASFVENWMESLHDVCGLRRNHAIYSRIIGENEYPYDTKSLKQAYDTYMNENSEENLHRLMMEHLCNNDILVQQMIRYKLRQSGYLKENKEAWYYKTPNFDYLEEKVYDAQCCFILVQTSENVHECDILASVLCGFGHPVYRLMDTVISNDISVTASIDMTRDVNGVTEIPIMGDEQGNTNVCELIGHLYGNCIQEHYAILVADRDTWEKCMCHPLIQKHVECLMDCNTFIFPEKLCFGWAGDYKRYISDIYCDNVDAWIDLPSACDFSIVIPARNSAGTLYYTLQTCLNQDYSGSYEIIVSDNSTGGRQEVYQVCRDLNDSRIHYVKTPRNLSLTKSFEFAFLQARGEFIFSLGSDDGVCPWTLSILSNVIKAYPEEEVLQWKRGYYVWKGYPGHKENEFVIPGQFGKEIVCNYVDRIEYFARVLKYSFNMYSLPTMYVNSGFHRSYLKKLLVKTGRLWDGCNQDLYMGVISAAINDNILNINFPLTLVGISENSLGYLVGKTKDKWDTDKKKNELVESTIIGDNRGSYRLQGVTKEIPIGRGEVYSLYSNILRAIQLGVLPDSWRTELLDYKKIFIEFFEEHICIDDQFDKYLHYARYVAEKRGREFLKWFDETIYNPAVIPKYYKKKPESAIKVKSYQEGIDIEGQLVLDASKYGITNIAEAVKLFSELIYWTPETYEEELEKRRVND